MRTGYSSSQVKPGGMYMAACSCASGTSKGALKSTVFRSREERHE